MNRLWLARLEDLADEAIVAARGRSLGDIAMRQAGRRSNARALAARLQQPDRGRHVHHAACQADDSLQRLFLLRLGIGAVLAQDWKNIRSSHPGSRAQGRHVYGLLFGRAKSMLAAIAYEEDSQWFVGVGQQESGG